MQNIVAAQIADNEYLPRNNVRKEMLTIKARIFKDVKTDGSSFDNICQ